MESEKTSKSAKGEAATTAQRHFTAERHSETHVCSAEGGRPSSSRGGYGLREFSPPSSSRREWRGPPWREKSRAGHWM
ncbi:hypothetical protein LR48_Vigan01g124600 [Vigna angularis]|uniref:Uncharacterized protein n=1 Tax=Phaseolus angularis TaxID=3914 RepID=A0A0L9TMK6_PHAAN|nr:hypothetical protein LR48_Vigan01g124600 [Vigna angularis]